ncbi:diguanylate cyclase domain-containing protein [Picosynechococcus sp. NKBG15041c]|uniref:diguanylate cyclase domain-containing protein n=1 Tax=Picosynechococcus sp. NKBG15041c TaxID=1407650 RepID=UPI000423FB7E|nr:diguanylate cyclase [Picosynechococcus sp. NKBG15041c]
MELQAHTLIKPILNSFDWGVMVVLDDQTQVFMNDTCAQLFQLSDETREFAPYDEQIAHIGRQFRDQAAFFGEIHDTENQPLLETQELFHTIDGRSLEIASQPITADYVLVGRIWHFREFTNHPNQGSTAFVRGKRQALIATVVAQTYHQRHPKEILSNVVNALGEVFAIERALIYQLDSEIHDGLRLEWLHKSFPQKCGDYYRYLQNNPWIWNFYSQVQCVHLGRDDTDASRKIHQILEQLQVQTCLSFPIIIHDRLWGVLLLHCCHGHREWLPDEIEFLETLSNQMAIAIHQDELNARLTTTQNQIRATNTTDELTLIPNARRFEQVLEKEWQRLAREELPLAILYCRIDYFDLYQETYGEELADGCLQQVSWAIALVCQRPADLVARCGREEFGVILPNTDLDGALYIADQILTSVQKLRISHLQSPREQYVSLSVGMNAFIPNLTILPSELIQSAQQALDAAAQAGGNQIKVGEMLTLEDIALSAVNPALDW